MFDKPWAEGSYQPHRGCGTHATVLTTAGPMLAIWGLKSQLMRSRIRNFSALRADGHQLRSLCIDIVARHDEAIHAITVIRLNLNPPFKNPRSTTADSPIILVFPHFVFFFLCTVTSFFHIYSQSHPRYSVFYPMKSLAVETSCGWNVLFCLINFVTPFDNSNTWNYLIHIHIHSFLFLPCRSGEPLLVC